MKENLIQLIRKEIKDDVEPYLNEDAVLLMRLEEAVADYSNHRPRQRRQKIELIPGEMEYNLPEDYLTWIAGLEEYEILGNVLYLTHPVLQSHEITFTYWAAHTVETIPRAHISALLDYIMFKEMDSMVHEGTEISGLRLGKGLDIDFGNFDELNKAAQRRWNNYLNKVSGPVGGFTGG